jgi:crotonobetainyl-CoA:carnitine CoA-transferase CaiB-like acyl-CoA transferase
MQPTRVIDFTHVLAGPWATQILGDQGFDVVKIEPPEGDQTRAFLPHRDGESVYFASTNRNKRSVVLNLKTPEGLAGARRLIATADVLVENFRPGVMDGLGLGWDAVRHDRLVYCSISAFGGAHPGSGYDLVLQSLGGIATLTGDPPQKAGPSIADLATAMFAVQGILFALLERERTGLGRRIDLSMLAVQHSLLAYYASAWQNAGKVPPAPSNAHPSIAPYNLYRTGEGWLAICCANDGLWARLRDALGLPARAEWATIADRVADRARLDAAIEASLATSDAATWERRLGEAGVPCGRALTVQESLAHPFAQAWELGGWTFPAPPLRPVAHRPPPALGEHTEELLGGLDLGR